MTQEEVMEQVINRSSRFWKNCCQQRKKPAKICLECPFIDYKIGKLKPEILIKDPDQRLPKMPEFYNDWGGKSGSVGYSAGRGDMLKDNWVKVLPKEEK